MHTHTHRVNKVVNIYDRHGEHKSEVLIVLPGYVRGRERERERERERNLMQYNPG